MPLTMKDIAARIELSFRGATWPDVLNDLLAEQVEFRHVPAIPEYDATPWTKDALVFNLEQKNRAWRNAIPDREFAKLKVTNDENSVTATYEMVGTAPSGQRLAVQSRMQFFVTEEKISGIEAWVDESMVPALLDALLDGGYVRENERASRAVPRG